MALHNKGKSLGGTSHNSDQNIGELGRKSRTKVKKNTRKKRKGLDTGMLFRTMFGKR